MNDPGGMIFPCPPCDRKSCTSVGSKVLFPEVDNFGRINVDQDFLWEWFTRM